MTQIELDACRAIINIAHTLSKKEEINWEQRRYEIAKDFAACSFGSPYHGVYDAEQVIKNAVKHADILIAELKKK